MSCSASSGLFTGPVRLAAVLLLTTAITAPHLAWAQGALLVGAGGVGGSGSGSSQAAGGAGGIGGGGGGGGTLAEGGGGGGGLFGGGGGAGSTSTDYYNGGAGNGGAGGGGAVPSASSGAGGTTSALAGYQGGAGGSSSAYLQSGGGGGGLGGAGGAVSGTQATAGATGGVAGHPQTSDVKVQTSPYTISGTSTYAIIGVGGGGGGGGGGHGSDGSDGQLTVSGNVTSTYVLVGGDGGGASLSNGGKGGNGTLNLAKNGILTINQSGQLILGGGKGGATPTGFGGAGGSGTLNMDDGSTLVLGAGAVVDTGADIYSKSNGGAAGTFTLSGASTIEVNGADTATISAPIGGSGALVKTGTGTLTLAASSSGYTYSGGTDIEAGVLNFSNVNGTYAAAANGPLTFGANNGGTYGKLNVAGTVDLSSAVINVKPASGTYTVGTAYTLITASSITNTGALAQPNMVGPYAAYLTASGAVVSNTYQIKITPYNGGGGLAFTSGRFYGANFYAQNAALFATLAAPVGTNVGYWTSGVGSFGHVPGANYNYKGFVVGRGFEVNKKLVIGAAFSNVYTNTNGLNNSSVSGTNFGGQVYGIYTLPKWTITSSVAVGHLGNNATRVLPGIGQGKFASNGVYTGALLQAQYDLIDRTHVFVTPYAGVSYLYTSTGNGQETGAGILNLHYGPVKTSLAQANGGLDAGYRLATTHGLLTAWVGLGGVGTLGNTHTRIMETLGTQSAGVTSQVATVGAFAPEVGVQLAGANRPWKLAANWGGQFANKTSAQNFTLQGSYRF